MRPWACRITLMSFESAWKILYVMCNFFAGGSSGGFASAEHLEESNSIFRTFFKKFKLRFLFKTYLHFIFMV